MDQPASSPASLPAPPERSPLLDFDLVIFDLDGTLRTCAVPGQPCPNRLGEQALVPGARELLQGLRAAGVKLAVATNQARIALGHLSARAHRELLDQLLREWCGLVWVGPQDAVREHLEGCAGEEGEDCDCTGRHPEHGLLGWCDLCSPDVCTCWERRAAQEIAVYTCPHGPPPTWECRCRKPAPGLLLDALRDAGVEPARAAMVGDQESDQVAAERAGVAFFWARDVLPPRCPACRNALADGRCAGCERALAELNRAPHRLAGVNQHLARPVEAGELSGGVLSLGEVTRPVLAGLWEGQQWAAAALRAARAGEVWEAQGATPELRAQLQQVEAERAVRAPEVVVGLREAALILGFEDEVVDRAMCAEDPARELRVLLRGVRVAELPAWRHRVEREVGASAVDLPACCHPAENASLAEVLYCAYQRGGAPERAGLAWDGRPCPTWAELRAKQEAGDAAAAGVVEKWRAVARRSL